MADNHTPEQRHKNMSRIRYKDTNPEWIVRKYLFSRGLRYRKNCANLPGKPDIVLKKYKTVIFVNGCFWHHHNCENFKWPLSNAEYWKNKIEKNERRDEKNIRDLIKIGWKVIVVWECELNTKTRDLKLSEVYSCITEME